MSLPFDRSFVRRPEKDEHYRNIQKCGFPDELNLTFLPSGFWWCAWKIWAIICLWKKGFSFHLHSCKNCWVEHKQVPFTASETHPFFSHLNLCFIFFLKTEIKKYIKARQDIEWDFFSYVCMCTSCIPWPRDISQLFQVILRFINWNTCTKYKRVLTIYDII